MTPDRFKTVRSMYGLSQSEFGSVLGFDGDPQSIARKVRRYESGETTIEGPLKKLLEVMAVVRLA